MKLLSLLVGESGCGKSTLTDRLIEKFKNHYHKVLSTVSRSRREGEVDGQDYYFSNRETIEQLRDIKQLVQLTEFSGNYYCTRQNDYIGCGETSILSVVPDHVMTVLNYFRQPHLSDNLMFQVIYFDSSDDLLERHLGDNWEERVKRGNIRQKFMELYPHIKQHVDVEFVDDRLVNDNLHLLMHEFFQTKINSAHSKYLIESEGAMEFRNNPRLIDLEGSMGGITNVVELQGLEKALIHSPNFGKKDEEWTKFAFKNTDMD